MFKKTIFISNANPENNYFAAWLSGKLRLFGYKVCVAVKDRQGRRNCKIPRLYRKRNGI